MGMQDEHGSRKRNLFRGLVLLVWCVVAIFACREPSEKAPAPHTKITIAYPATILSVLYTLAFVKGFFEAEGLEIVPDFHEFGKMALNSMLDGKADMAVTADTPVMHAITGGREMSIIALTTTSRRAIAVIGRRDRGIIHPSDLRGRTVGLVLGTTGDFFLDSFVSTRGMSRRELNVVDLRPKEMLDALLSGRVDAVTIWNPTLAKLKRALGDRGVLFHDEVIYSDIACVVASPEFVEKHPEAVRSVLMALLKAEAFIRDNPEESRRVSAEFLKLDVEAVEEIWDSYDFRVTLEQSLIISLEDQTRWARQRGLSSLTDMPNYLDFVYFDGLLSVKPEAVRIMR